jgi:hypothetical protein
VDLATLKKEWTEHVLTLAPERFERRLAEELSAIRVEIARGDSELRKELHEGFAAFRVEMANLRADVLRWSFLFWLGQLAAMATMFGYMLQVLER